MKKSRSITTLFLDIGGVLLSNGWDHHARKRAAMNFKMKAQTLIDTPKTQVAGDRVLPATERTGI